MTVDTETLEHDDIADVAADDLTDEATDDEAGPVAGPPRRRAIPWTRLLAFGVLPGLALTAALGLGYVKWQHDSTRSERTAAEQSVQAAKDSTVAILSYRPDTVDTELTAAVDRLTGDFRDEYTQLITDVVAPGAKQQQISATATIPAAASVSATADKAVVLVLVDQTTTVAADPPTTSASSVRVTLDKVGDRWLISQFEPV
ncbi:hypothetical protein [Mycolicibacterium arseniciresistens]|uniref:Outer membrane protein n=1 Tax=Mycolicibacterium arseniciresistens TaxID=3062257 RepID=A0ABT8UE05_9MYCO|nr:hypothetical protein [Mycolicibacterium arseniciresistens]MDO3636021.1 hypothetical protein [Mycolicibacterium arseniciresistens]